MVGLPLLAGCQPQGPEAQYSNYLTRLGRTLSVDVPVVNYQALTRPPRSGQLRLDIPSSSLDGLDFLALRGCAVQVTIGKRNSSLGRLASASQRLLLELEYLQLAPKCISYLQQHKRATLADTLEQAWQMKRLQLPALIFNATLASAEYRAFWQTPATPGAYPAATSSQVISALLAINSHVGRWLSGDYQADNREFEILLGEVAGGDGGALLQGLARQQEWLAAADVMLEQRMARGPLCSPGIRPAAADILPNIIRKYFIGELQTRAASLGRRYHELLPPIESLEKLLTHALPVNYLDWQSDRNTRFATLVGAPRRHVKQIMAVQQPCIKA